MRRNLIRVFILIFMALLVYSIEKPDIKKQTDPYEKIASDMKQLSRTLSRQSQSSETKNYSSFKLKEDRAGSYSVNRNIHTDFLFNTYKIWNVLFDMSRVRSEVKNKLKKLSDILVGNHGYFFAIFFAVLILEVALQFYSGKLSLESLVYTFFFAITIYLILHNYETIFAQIDRGFKEIVPYLISEQEWKRASHTLLSPLFSFSGEASVITSGNPLGLVAILTMIAKLIVSVFVYIALYFLYLPSITIPPLAANLLLMGLYFIGKFILILSVLSPFRGLLKSFFTFMFAIEIYIVVFAVIVTAIGNSINASMHQFLNVDNFLSASLNWLETIVFIGPLTALFVVIDVVSYSLIRGVLTGLPSSVGFSRFHESSATLGLKSAETAVTKGVSMASGGVKIASSSVQAGVRIINQAPSPVPRGFNAKESPHPRS